MTHSSQHISLAPRPISRLAGCREICSHLINLVRLWRHRARTRMELSDLEPHMLRDIGVTPEQAEHEIAKPFWR
ncbi:MAG: DUF1127 domain-containing protein [Pseudomonadota bacterium]